MKTLSTIVAAALLAASAQGRISETEAQIDARYGKPIRTDTKLISLLTKVYHFRDLSVIVSFVDGISEYEHFSKLDGGKLAENEVDVLLQANSGSGKWTVKLDGVSRKLWAVVEEGCETGLPECSSRFATFSSIEGDLTITSKKFMDREKALSDEAAKKKLKDF